ncbi:MAG: sel1 repeat family protein [Betaproteobacteria bacterium]|nr:sel1 repeat family protein [Betaproteobacteria bacterium]
MTAISQQDMCQARCRLIDSMKSKCLEARWSLQPRDEVTADSSPVETWAQTNDNVVNQPMSKPSMSKTTSALLVLLLLIAKSSIVTAGPWEDGYAAYQRKDYTLAVEKWRVVAQTGKAEAQSLLGLMYFFGQGVKQDYPQAITWLRLAAAQGEAKAMYKLGAMHENGQGFTQDNVRAAIWYTMAAKQGHPQANDALKLVSAGLSPKDSALASRLAQTCIKRAYKDCESVFSP